MQFLNFVRDTTNFEEELEAKRISIKHYRGLSIATYPKRNDREGVDFTDPVVRDCRGTIFRKDPENNQVRLVCRGFTKFLDNETDKWLQDSGDETLITPEIDIRSPQFQEILNRDTTRIVDAIDGSLIRLYWNDGRWRVATTRCIESKRARWNSYKSFYDMYDEARIASGLSYDDLDTTQNYFYILQHPQNRIVTPYEKARLVPIATFEANTGKVLPLETEPEHYKFSNVDELLESVMKLDWKHPGYVLSFVDSDGAVQRTRFRNPNFETISRLRGDRQSMTRRYLEMKRESNDEGVEQLNMFKMYYGEVAHLAESSVENLARFIHQAYLDYFVHHSVKYVDNPDIWNLLKELHTRFIRTREKTTVDTVRNTLKSMPIGGLMDLLEPPRRAGRSRN
jgi:hypothetical protein